MHWRVSFIRGVLYSEYVLGSTVHAYIMGEFMFERFVPIREVHTHISVGELDQDLNTCVGVHIFVGVLIGVGMWLGVSLLES